MNYTSLVGYAQGAKRLHMHLTEIPDTSTHVLYEHRHQAEEAFFILEGSAEYEFDGQRIVAGPGDVVFIPAGVWHAKVSYRTPTMKYLTIRSVEPEDEPCCCGQDRYQNR